MTAALLPTDAGLSHRADLHQRRQPAGAPRLILVACFAGHGWGEIAGERHVLSAGGALLIPPGTPHAFGSDARAPWTVGWIHLAGAQVPAWVEVLGARRQPLLALGEWHRCAALMEELVEVLARDHRPGALLAASGISAHLLGLLASAPGADPAAHGDRATRAIAYVRARLAERPTVAELAALVELSPSHYTAMFRRATGHAPIAFALHLRMEAAARLLRESRQPITRIAEQLGYTDPFLFSRQFRAAHDCSPRAWRQRHGQDQHAN